jgi:hypothetical protein
MNATVITLARHYARREVKAAILRNQGHRGLREIESAELTRLAAGYLDSHPEIIERAAKTVSRDPALRRMAERHERKRLTCASA